MFVEVLRPFEADLGVLERGAIVDATDWRLMPQLIEQRYVRPAPEKPAKRPAKESHNG